MRPARKLTTFLLVTVPFCVGFAVPSRLAAIDTGANSVRIDLYASFEFEYQIDDEGNGDPNASFDADQIDVVLNYTRDQFRIALDAVFEHGTATEDDRGNVAISFGFAEYRHSDKLLVRLGKYLSPFGAHNESNSIKAQFLSVKIPDSTNKPDKLTSNGFRFFPRRQVGLALLGTVSAGERALKYHATLTNGEQEETNPFEEDNNSQKALTLSAVYETKPGLTVGLSSYLDTLSASDEKISLQSLSGQLKYEGQHLRVWAEVVVGELDHDSEAINDISQTGGFAEVGYGFSNGLTPYFQLQHVETDEKGLQQSAQTWIAGIYYRFKEYAVLKLENAYLKGSSANPEFNELPGRDYNEIRAAAILGF